jgi:hypothetical protein
MNHNRWPNLIGAREWARAVKERKRVKKKAKQRIKNREAMKPSPYNSAGKAKATLGDLWPSRTPSSPSSKNDSASET